MSSKKYAAPLRLEPKRSRPLAAALAACLAGAVLLPFLVPVGLPIRLILLVTIAAVAHEAHARHFGRRRIVRAVWDELDEWRLYLADGTEWEAQLEGDSFVIPEVTILNFRAEGRRFHLFVVGGTLDGETRRRLRVRLRMEARRRSAAQEKEKMPKSGGAVA